MKWALFSKMNLKPIFFIYLEQFIIKMYLLCVGVFKEALN